ncbi:MAG: hypothetical protein CME68_04010 [Halobacteriovoraceae bacterium]|nr:hypothetical protein [Halobacteriovoraceae bacterium]
MKEQTLNLEIIFKDKNLRKTLDSFFVQIYDEGNKLIFENDVETNNKDKVKGYPITLPGGHVAGILRTKEKYKDALMKLIQYEINQFFKIEKNEHLDLRFSDLLKDYVRFLGEGFTFNSKKTDFFLVNYLNIMKGYFIFEGVQLFLVEEDNFIYPYMDFSNKDVKYSDSNINTDLIDLAQAICTVQKKLYIEDCKTDTFLRSTIPGVEFKYDNLLSFPLFQGNDKLGCIVFYNFKSKKLDGDKIEEIQSFVSLVSRYFMNFKNFEKQDKTNLIFRDLKKYVSKQMVGLRKNKDVSLVGVEKNITVLFGQIHGFQKIYKILGPKKLMYLLNIHYEFLIKIAESFGGTVDKILGESLMVIWNHPFEQSNPNDLSYQAAKKMIECARESIKPIWSSLGISNYSYGIGINSGLAVAGNLGSKKFMDFTVIGDTVNVAQRLETQTGPWEILIHENVYKNFKGEVDKSLVMVDGIKLKGKAFETKAYLYNKK